MRATLLRRLGLRRSGSAEDLSLPDEEPVVDEAAAALAAKALPVFSAAHVRPPAHVDAAEWSVTHAHDLLHVVAALLEAVSAEADGCAHGACAGPLLPGLGALEPRALECPAATLAALFPPGAPRAAPPAVIDALLSHIESRIALPAPEFSPHARPCALALFAAAAHVLHAHGALLRELELDAHAATVVRHAVLYGRLVLCLRLSDYAPAKPIAAAFWAD